ncbi:zf-HC2 domain-containing protein [Paenibacillus tepidiphilus]|uniref:zf-HC2 domain-containing protein n=1 Tax=Paenibacillus tepidiphilus TaxID=2608683 RepID=UPI00123AEEC4|nr:zf-HC2 domain-containing protein [Paenibacillus tepidiphilus]
MTNTLSCEIVEDLLPLYHDEVCSIATREAVASHLATCSHCAAALDKLRESSRLPFEVMEKNRREGEGLSSFKKYWHRTRVHSFVKGLLIATAVCGLAVLGYAGLFRWNIIEVPSSVIRISEISRLSNGKIAYRVNITDGYIVNQINGRLDDDGNYYYTPVRPVIKSSKFAELGLGNGYHFFDLEMLNANRTDPSIPIKAIYYGPKDGNPVLIWQQGMELPPAAAAVEAQFHFAD